MFTGIVTDVGHVTEATIVEGWLRLSVAAPKTADRVNVGASVSVGGVCLTVNAVEDGVMNFSILPETLRVTNIGAWQAGTRVNLETSLHMGDELGGHLVYGHVDGIGTVVGVEKEGESTRMTFQLPPTLMRYTAPKGSIAIDGVSLTIAGLTDTTVAVALVEYTLAHTTLGTQKVGDMVHVETDMLLKYFYRLYEMSGTFHPNGT